MSTKEDKFRVSKMSHLVLNEYVLFFPRAPEDERYPSTEAQPNGFIAGGRNNYYRIRRAGKNGSLSAAVVYRDPAMPRYVFLGNLFILETGDIVESPYLEKEQWREIRNRALQEYMKEPGMTRWNMAKSFTRVQSTVSSPSYQRARGW